MATLRTSLCLVLTLAGALAVPVQAQTQPQLPPTYGVTGLQSSWLPASRNYLGLNLGRSNNRLPCSSMALLCDDRDSAMRLYAGTMVGNFWGMELAYLDNVGRARSGAVAGAQGLNLSLVGKAPLSRTFGVYGRLGTTVGRPATSVLGGSAAPAAGFERGFGLSYGAGVSVAFTPRLSATLQWESNDFRFAGSIGDQVRSTSLGLQYRY